MSFRLRAATLVAMTVSAFAAIMASDATLAGESPAAASGSTPVLISSAVSAASVPATPSRNVAFGPTREIVQPFAAIGAKPGLSSFPGSARSLDAMVAAYDTAPSLDDEGRCLAGAIYFEAKSESLIGQLAVARVVINRARSGRFASSLCGVVYQPGQFSFVRGRSMPSINQGSRDWQEAAAIAEIALDNKWENPAEGALYFHARRVSPNWGRQRVAAIDNHIFYR
ncbi:cell wall hydrolase [Sphingobium subterraneum]|uniref:Cell wall hydrolase SleB domain-containing protein n=1 Tax=Sphingobium subterraneum TaxID=627688 RepID=A0A841J085_9SPHN|nr:cell wall hydrolase [Sphingobium subterraneum]MBB6124094.1 hypothetical protein [Sphingobium subterraneum]